MEALDRGCHVLLEKPMVTSAQHAYKIKDKVHKTGKVFLVGYNTSFTPEFHYLREQIRHKAFGKLEMVQGYLSQDWLKLTVGKWRQDPKLSGGGQAYDSGAHLLNSLCWSVESPVEEVFAYVDNCGAPVDINSVFVVKFTSGAMASMMVSGNCPSAAGSMVFIFDNGRVEIDGWSGSYINVWHGGEKVKYPPVTGKPLQPSDNFIDAILGRDEPRTGPVNGIIHSELMDAIYESARTGLPARPKRKGRRS
jgi:predicted dehydrogenase